MADPTDENDDLRGLQRRRTARGRGVHDTAERQRRAAQRRDAEIAGARAAQDEAESGVFGKKKRPSDRSAGNQKGPITRPPSPEAQEWLDTLDPIETSGIGGTKRPPTDVPNFIACESEDVIQNGNAWIVLGGDRPGNIGTGAGGAGDTHSYSIDLVAGRMGSRAAKKDKKNDVIYVNPSFTLDSARVYISQKSDIDHYLKLHDEICETHYDRPASCVAIKADAVRLVSRESIKLVTCTDHENSQGGNVGMNYGIHLIAQNDPENLQSMVLGENLLEALQALYKQVQNNRTMLLTFLSHQKDFNRDLLTHNHFNGVIGWTSLSPQAAKAGIENMIKLVSQVETQIYAQMGTEETKKIDALTAGGAKYVLSPLNKNN